MKARLRVRFVNSHGLEEAGFGGGVMKEYLSELGAIAFNPEMGLFAESPDRLLYPNPASGQIVGRHLETFELLGRILGKAMYEAILIDVPFADFFLWKLLGETSALSDLASLDAELHRQLLWLKRYDGDVAALSLNFAVSSSSLFGESVHELVPGGAGVAVTAANKMHYVYAVANWRLNGEISAQVAAFRRGFASMVPTRWLQMFDQRELRNLLSGTEAAIDVADWEAHTHYAGGLSADHPQVVAFWAIVRELSAEDRAALLKFATSCSRAPVLGFRELQPQFSIQGTVADDERLPTAATCFNLLKMSFYSSAAVLREKLLYAIRQNAGFELS
eukprot:c34704_g1_i1.p1 GENE.c34704_g1_i1~~c34704_g1_i1.p1  ORF type:complete len:374 (+),score=61.05 c34704_g1_i1:124-1122(+)